MKESKKLAVAIIALGIAFTQTPYAESVDVADYTANINVNENTDIIQDGYYAIASAMDEKALIHVAGNSIVDDAQIEIWDDTDIASEIFYVEKQNDGYYKIINAVSQKSINVRDASPESGAELQQKTYDGTDGQKWSIQSTEDGYYIISTVFGTVVDCAGGNIQNGNRILLCESNNGMNQKWSFFRNGVWGGGRARNTSYLIVSAEDIEKCIMPAIGGSQSDVPLVIDDKSFDDDAMFNIEQTEGNIFKISNKANGQSLCVKDASKESGAKLVLKQFDATESQQWMLEPTANGYFYIRSVLGTTIDLPEGNTNNGNEIILCEHNGNTNQQWALLPEGCVVGDIGFVPADKTSVPDNEGHTNPVSGQVESGLYVITSAMDNNKALHIADDGTASGSVLDICDYTGSPTQRFLIVDNGDGTYHITTEVAQDLVLDVRDASSEPGAIAQIREYDGTIGETWTIRPTSDGMYYMIVSGVGTCLDCFEAKSDNYTPVTMFTVTEAINQQWSLTRVG